MKVLTYFPPWAIGFWYGPKKWNIQNQEILILEYI